MTEEKKEEMAPQGGQAVGILGQFIKDLSFENPDPISFLASENAQPHMNMDVQVNAHALKDDHFEVVLVFKLTAKQEEKIVFLAELSYSTLVNVNIEAVGKENLNPVLLIHVPHMSFPFVRAILSNLIREGGLPPFAIHPIDFAALYEQNVKSENKTVQ